MKTPEKFVDLLGHKNDITDKKQTLWGKHFMTQYV